MKRSLLAASLALILSSLTALGDGVVFYTPDGEYLDVWRSPVSAKTGVVDLASNIAYQTALKSDGTIITWGNKSWLPTVPADLGTVKSISAGGRYTAAILTDGSVRVWGSADPALFNIPQAAKSGVVSISCGGAHILALKNDGSVVAWGRNDDGQVTIPADAQQGVIAVCAGSAHSMNASL